ncbi:hypothetical protein AB0M35_28315 [Micromonospora sp. NPDC051196]|uniref:Hsp70 family protein n=1 Tax=Micromonospora sp. NPDC051196 TaxID=3155281 RepID=UPI00342842CC
MDWPRVVAAIDFGTHGSGYAWAVVDSRNDSRSQRDINDCQVWPDSPRPYPKTLTALLLRGDEVQEWGHTAEARFGTLVAQGQQDHRFVHGLKMSLRPRNDPAREREAQSDLPGIADRLGDPVPLISEYLRRLHAVAVADITKNGIYRETDIRWCLTVPAMWSEKSMADMRLAAGKAGLPTDSDKLLLVPEPDAAALFCNIAGIGGPEGEDAERGRLRVGSRFVVVDCGGGTVDLVTYQVGDDDTVEQICRPTGGPFGAEYTSRSFVLDTLGRCFGGDLKLNRLRKDHPAQVAALVSSWELLRNRRTIDDTDPIHLDLPSRLRDALGRTARKALAKAQKGDDTRIVIPALEVRRHLDAVVDRIIDCVLAQLTESRAKPGAGAGSEIVFLVGGFAASPYLRQRLSAALKGTARLVVPQHPERAVLFGATHFCYAPYALSARVARFTYGCKIALPFEPGDDQAQTEEDEDDSTRRLTTNRFNKFVSINDRIPAGHEAPAQVFVPTQSAQDFIEFGFFASEHSDPRYVTEPGVRKIGRLRIKLEGSMHLPRVQREVDVHMRFDETEINVRAVNRHTGLTEVATLAFEDQ